MFLARNGYIVTAFDLSETGIEKGKRLAEKCNTYVDFFKADITDFRVTEYYDIIFSSRVFHFIKPEIREEITANLKECTNKNGIHIKTAGKIFGRQNVFVLSINQELFLSTTLIYTLPHRKIKV